MSVSTTITTSDAISQYWHKKTLNKLEAETHLYTLGWKDTVVPGGNGKTVNWVRFPLAAADVNASVEGVPIVPETLTANNISTTLVQYVAAVSFSDVLQEETFIEGGMEEAAAEFIAQKLKYTIDALNRSEINSTTTSSGNNLFTPLSDNTDIISGITPSDVLVAADLRRARSNLANKNVPKFTGEKYAFIIHTACEFDVRSQSAAGSFLDLLKQSDSGIKDIKAGLVGDIFGLSIYASSLMPSALDGTANIRTFKNYAFGEQALGIAELRGKRMEIIRKKGGDSGNTYDLANQIGGAVAYNTVYAVKNLSESASNARILRIAAASAL